MDKLLRICGIIFLSLLGLGLVLGLIFIPRAWMMSSSAASYINLELPKVTENWDPEEVLKNAVPEFRASAPEAQITLLWNKFRLLGKLKSHDEPVGGVVAQAYTGGATGTFGNYTVHAHFENADADVMISLKRVGDDWKFYSFRINSDIFLR